MWVLLYRDGTTRKYATLGVYSKMSKSAGGRKAGRAGSGSERTQRQRAGSRTSLSGNSSKGLLSRFCGRKWKRSTAATTENRIQHHLKGEFGERRLTDLGLKELQSFLNAKAEKLSRSVVAHLRWDLRSVFRLALAEGYTDRDPTAALFTPREAAPSPSLTLSKEEVEHYINALDPRERVIALLAIFAGMRPGEILALQRRHVSGDCRKARHRAAPLPRRHRHPEDDKLHAHRRHSAQDGHEPEGMDGSGARATGGMGIRFGEPFHTDVEG